MSSAPFSVLSRGAATRVGRRGALGVAGLAVLAGCGFVSNEIEGDPDLSGLEEAVEAASARVTDVERSERLADGLGHAVLMTLRLDTAEPPTPEELDVIVEAIWQHVPWEPNGIDLVAVAGDASVDLRAAAADLAPMRSLSYGQGGVSLIGVRDRYGEWGAPE